MTLSTFIVHLFHFIRASWTGDLPSVYCLNKDYRVTQVLLLEQKQKVHTTS